MDDYGDVYDKTQILSRLGVKQHHQVCKIARYVRAQRVMCNHASVCENVVIGALVALCELHVGLTLGLIDHVIVVVFVVAILQRIFCVWRYTLHTPRR